MHSKGKKRDNIPTPRVEGVRVTVFVATESTFSQREKKQFDIWFATADSFIVVKTKKKKQMSLVVQNR